MQTLLAVTEATKDVLPEEDKVDYSKYLVLSLGTGSAKSYSGTSVADGIGWGAFDWLYGIRRRQLLLDVFFGAMDDMVHIYLSTFFRGPQSSKNYLRFQVKLFTCPDIQCLLSVTHCWSFENSLT